MDDLITAGARAIHGAFTDLKGEFGAITQRVLGFMQAHTRELVLSLLSEGG